MFEKLDVVKMAQGLAAHSAARHALVAGNVANADTPGYKAQDLPGFAEVFQKDAGPMRATRPGHLGPLADAAVRPIQDRSGSDPNGNSVSLEVEMVRAADIRQQHDMALSIYRASSDILKASLGRAR